MLHSPTVPEYPSRPSLRVIRDEDAPPYDSESQPANQQVGFAMIPADVFALNDGTCVAVYAVLAKHANKDGICWPSMKRLEESLGWSDNRIRPALKKLIAAGLVSIEKRQLNGMDQSNAYRLQTNVQVSRDRTAVSRSGALGIPPQDSGYPATGHELKPIELDPIELDREGGKQKASRRKPETDVPDELPLREADYTWAEGKGFSRAQCDRERDAMLTWHGAKGNRFRDWHLAWRTWMSRAKPDVSRGGTAANGAMPLEIRSLPWNSAVRLKWENDHRSPQA